MSSSLPVMTADELINLLRLHGFVKIGQKGSHVKMRSSENVTIIIPSHSGRNIKPGLLLSILNRAGIDVNSIRR